MFIDFVGVWQGQCMEQFDCFVYGVGFVYYVVLQGVFDYLVYQGVGWIEGGCCILGDVGYVVVVYGQQCFFIYLVDLVLVDVYLVIGDLVIGMCIVQQ